MFGCHNFEIVERILTCGYNNSFYVTSIYLQFSVNCIICEMFNDTLDQIRCIRLTYVVFNVMASHMSLYLVLILKKCEILLHFEFLDNYSY